MGDYLAAESAYLAVLRAMLEEAQVRQLRLLGLEVAEAPRLSKRSRWREGAKLTIKQSVEFAQLALREKTWGLLVSPRRAFVHFGWDYYMYLGLSRPTPRALALAANLGIFVEPCQSPYSATAKRTARRVARAGA